MKSLLFKSLIPAIGLAVGEEIIRFFALTKNIVLIDVYLTYAYPASVLENILHISDWAPFVFSPFAGLPLYNFVLWWLIIFIVAFSVSKTLPHPEAPKIAVGGLLVALTIFSLFAYFEAKQDIDTNYYKNRELGYRIIAPLPGWEIVENSIVVEKPGIEIIDSGHKGELGDEGLLITAEQGPVQNQSIPDWLASNDAYNGNGYDKNVILLPFSIGGEKAWRIYYRPRGGGIPTEDTFIRSRRGGVFHFSCLVSFEGYPDYSKYQSSEECDLMLKTFLQD